MGADRSGIGMSGIDHQVNADGRNVSGEPRGTAEPTNPDRAA